jgi:valyl-tRNA synthetase
LNTPNKDNDLFYELGIRKGEDAREEQREEEKIAQLIKDLEAEKARLAKGAEAAEKERDSLAQRLSNPNFTERAKPEAVEKARADHEAKTAEAERLRAALERLG